MFVRNDTPYDPVLARGYVLDDLAIACISIELTFTLTASEQLSLIANPERAPTDPPDIRREALWRGCSVTLFGHVQGPPRGPFVRVVELRVGERAHRLVVFGERRWERRLGDVVASEPRPFDSTPLSWERAFGGTVNLQPGFFPGTELPHPGGEVSYPLNPMGKGLCLSIAEADGMPLPEVEDPQRPIQSAAETPIPAGCAPCPSLPQLRMLPPLVEPPKPDEELTAEQRLRRAYATSLNVKHHAPAPLVFDRVLPGATVAILGVGARTTRFSIPQPPARVTAVFGRGPALKPPARLRSLHVDADRGCARMVWGYLFRYSPNNLPRKIDVQEGA